jgi:hypothetical protein
MFDNRKRYPGQPLAVSGSSTGSFFLRKRHPLLLPQVLLLRPLREEI